jgi:phage terminase large subunit-like protein
VVEGTVEDDTIFAYVATLDDDDDPWDEANWIKANPNLEKSVWTQDLREAAARAQRSPAAQTAFFRFRLNMPSSSSIKGLDMRFWDSPENSRPPEPQRGWGCYAGLDLASVRDLTALVLAFRDDEDVYHIVCHFWCPREGIEERSRVDGVPYDVWERQGFLTATEGDITDYASVEAKLNELAVQYSIGEIAYDRWNATQLVTNLMIEGANVVPVTQNFAHLSAPWKEIERLVLEGMLRHGGNPVLRWMAENVELEMDPFGNVRPSKRTSSERIDGMVALDMAIGRWIVWGEAPAMGRAV